MVPEIVNAVSRWSFRGLFSSKRKFECQNVPEVHWILSTCKCVTPMLRRRDSLATAHETHDSSMSWNAGDLPGASDEAEVDKQVRFRSNSRMMSRCCDVRRGSEQLADPDSWRTPLLKFCVDSPQETRKGTYFRLRRPDSETKLRQAQTSSDKLEFQFSNSCLSASLSFN